MAVPTALTVQSTERVRQVLPVFPGVVRDQLLTLLADMLPQAIKVGMLATDDVLIRVADVLERFPVPRVVDPVLRSSSGAELLERRAWRNLLDRIVRGAALVTPNLDEAETLVGTRDPEAAARAFVEVGAAAVLIKGGHRDGPPDDYLYSPAGPRWLTGPRFPHDVHGTGCALSAAITAWLARGVEVEEAAVRAKGFVAGAIEHAFEAGRGRRILGLPRTVPDSV